ncbi:universal stress protein [Halovivax limisalsi]|uniref:universal stress protein n=1 Tax=Halovivax limisalsi TaxID=1453760 RepID=UPI001FFD863A|nr:universal stress protein [Halovivax limisalsi]
MPDTIFIRPLDPLANVADAERTCETLDQYPDSDVEQITVVFVIEQLEGFIDPASPEALNQGAEEVFSYVKDYFSNGPDINRALRAGTDTVEEIVAAADERDASAITFSPRPKTRFQQILTENSSYRLLSERHQPVVIFSKRQMEEK